MMSDKAENRRSFLKLAAAAPAAAAVAVAASETAQAEEAARPGKGLRKTAHVQAYLDTARF